MKKTRPLPVRAAQIALGLMAVLFSGAALAAEAEPSRQEFYVNGQLTEFPAYSIEGSNYVRLRDVGEAVGFNVYWDGRNVQVDTAAPYTGQPTEASEAEADDNRTPLEFLVDGRTAEFDVYTVDGEPYIKLQDIGETIGFNVYRDGNSIRISTAAPDTGQAPPPVDTDSDALPRVRLYLALACFLAVLTIWYLWRRVDRPLKQLEELFRRWPDTPPEELRRLGASIGGAPKNAAAAALERLEGFNDRISEIERDVGKDTEAKVRARIAEEISDSALPRPLESGTERFGLEGMTVRTRRSGCNFYDYFFLDAGLLAIVIGESPGNDVSAALFMVIAQTTIRSRLRMGRSLEQTMGDVNTQLYDLGSGRLLHVLVALLRTEDGMLSYVNAGGCRPLLMRHEERYEQLEDPVFSSLGENETVSYRKVQLRLRQGDRLFFATAGLGAMRDRNGAPFEKERLRSVLNRSRGQENGLPGMLRFVAGEASAYCESEADRMDYAAMLLEYRKGDKELAHCEVPALPQSVPELMSFLKKQFMDNGIPPAQYAKVAVIAEELFTLCCRRTRRETTVILECGVAPDGQSATLRMAACLNGINPVETARGPAEASAADFIRTQADFLTFTPEQERDILTVVYFWNHDLNAQPFHTPPRTRDTPPPERGPSFGKERAMQIHETRNGGQLVVALEGRLDRTTSPELEETLNGALDSVQELVLDFEKIDYVSSAGLRVLLTTHLQMNGRPFVLRNLNTFVQDVLSVTGFMDILTVE